MKTYKVKLNGKELNVYTTRVSAMPFNKVFDGVQRPIDQTEVAYFVTADISASAIMEITVNEGFENYEIRPLEYNLSDHRESNTVRLTIDKPMQFTFEADGFHNALHIFINEPSIKPNGDVLYYGKGEHNAGLIWLESGQTLYLEEGARVYGIIYAKDATDVKIAGRGIIDSSIYRRGDDPKEGSADVFDEMERMGAPVELKEKGHLCSSIVLYNCKNVYVEGITVVDSMFWAFTVRNHCENIIINNIKIIGQWRYNSDGIDICASKNVTIENSFIRSFDDCFVARAPYLTGEFKNVENIKVKNCVLWCDWGKSIEIWCGDKPCAIRNITFEDIYLIRLSYIGINITTWYGSEMSLVENIVYKNIYFNCDSLDRYMNILNQTEKTPIYVNRHKKEMQTVHIAPEKLGKAVGNQQVSKLDNMDEIKSCYRNIIFDNVHTNEESPIINIADGDDNLEIYGIVAKGCDFVISKT